MFKYFRIPVDIKDAAFCVGVKNSFGSSTFDMMFNLYMKTTSYSEKTSIELALGCSANRTQLNEFVLKYKSYCYYFFLF